MCVVTDGLDLTLLHFRHRSCCQKQRYASLDAANEGIAEVVAKFGSQKEPLHAYYCIFCNDFHTGRDYIRKSWQDDLERLLRFDFSMPCPECDKALRFTSQARPASGKGHGKPATQPQTEDWPPSTGSVLPEVEADLTLLPQPPSPRV